MLLQNFQSIPALITVDHVDFSVNNDYGKHNKVTFPLQNGIPATVANEFVLYNLRFNFGTTPTNLPEIFCRRNGGTAYPITATNGGYSYLPSGILLQWGQTQSNNPGGNIFADVVFEKPFDNANGYQIMFNAQLNPAADIDVLVLPSNRTTTGIRFNYNARIQNNEFVGGGLTTWTVHWFAVGSAGAI